LVLAASYSGIVLAVMRVVSLNAALSPILVGTSLSFGIPGKMRLRMRLARPKPRRSFRRVKAGSQSNCSLADRPLPLAISRVSSSSIALRCSSTQARRTWARKSEAGFWTRCVVARTRWRPDRRRRPPTCVQNKGGSPIGSPCVAHAASGFSCWLLGWCVPLP
jgi:hypothetical protein